MSLGFIRHDDVVDDFDNDTMAAARQKRLSSGDDELVKLRFKCKQQSAHVETLDAQLKKTNAELVDVTAQFEDSLQQLANLDLKHSQFLQKSDLQLKEWKKKVDAAAQMESTIASQKRELADRIAEIDRLRSDATRQNAAQRDADQLRAALDKAQSTCKTLERRLEASDSQIEQMQFGETELQALVDELRANVESNDEKYTKQIAQLEKDLGDSLQCAEGLALKLAAEHDAAVQAAEIAEQACVSNQVEADRAHALEAEVIELKRQLTSAAPAVDTAALDDARAALTRREHELEALQVATNEATSATLARHEAAIAAIAERHAADMAAAQTRLTTALADRDSLKAHIDAMEVATSDQALAHEAQLARANAESAKLRTRLAEVEAERDGAQCTNATNVGELETQLAEAQADLALRDEQIDSAVSERDALASKLAAAVRECDSFKQQIVELEQLAESDRSECAKLAEQVTMLEQMSKTDRTALEQAQTTLADRNVERAKLQSERSALEQQMAMLEQMAATDKVAFEQLQAALSAASAARDEARTAAAERATQLARAESRCDELAEALATAEHNASELAASDAARGSELSALRNERDALQSRVADAATASSERVRELEATCERSAAQVTNLERQLLESDERAVQMESECEAANVRVAALEADVQAKVGELTDAKSRLKTANTRAASTSQKQSDLEANVASRDTQIQDLQSQLQLTREIVAKHDAAAAAAVARMAQLEQQHAGCAAREAEVAERDARLRNANMRAQNVAHELAQANDKVTALEARCAALQTQTASLESQCSAMQTQSTTLRERLAAADAERDQKIAALQDELRRRGETLDAMAQAAEDATTSASVAAERLVAAENECARFGNEVSQLEQRLALKDEQLELKEEQLQLQQQQIARNSAAAAGAGAADAELLNELQEQLASKDDELVDVMEKYNDAIVQNKALIKSIGKLEAAVSALEASRRRRSPDNEEPTASMSSSPPSADNSPIVVVNLAGGKGKARSFTANKENEFH